MSGLEFVGVDGLDVGTWGGTLPDWAVFKTWGANVVRIPLNVASWLGLTTYNADGGTSFGAEPVLADPQGDYKQTVISAVAAAQAQGLSVILDLHWSAPQVTLGGSTHYITPDGQPEFMNASTDISFWTSIAQTFGTQANPQAGVRNAGVVFELFNEPYTNDYNTPAVTYGLMRDGGTVSTFHWNVGGSQVSPSGGVQLAGYQQVLDAIRSAGAHNVCVVNGPQFAQQAQNYTQWFPTDSLSPPQLAAGWHPYPDGTYPYSNGNVYGLTGGDPGGGNSSFAQWYQAILGNGIPVIITEDGGAAGTGATSGEPHMSYMEQWADTNLVSYVPWQWNPPMPYATSSNEFHATVYASDGKTILPIQGEGQTLYDWMSTHH